jgi:uncharacterized protein
MRALTVGMPVATAKHFAAKIAAGAVRAALAFVVLAAHAGPLEDGVAAYKRGDYATALRLLSPLAESGNARAQYNLGVMYKDGRGVPRDDVEAATWLRKAADQGFSRAQFAMGVMYQNGRGVPQDDAEAVRWYLWLPKTSSSTN